MTYQTAITVHNALQRVDVGEYVLPAIQREFVWGQGQIARLFDSLMRGYPIGTFLFWRVDSDTAHEFPFYDFILNFHETKAFHCPPRGAPLAVVVSAVLDGQQRLTALNIGLRGSHASYRGRVWRKSAHAYPVRTLHLNLLERAPENDEQMLYDLRFLTEDAARKEDETHHWFPVPRIMSMPTARNLLDYLQEHKIETAESAFDDLDRLRETVHRDPTISYYEEASQDPEKVLDIFIRTNSGGTPLSYSDLLLSMATSEWEDLNARDEIHDLVDELNAIGRGFSLDKDFVLKSGLMLCDIAAVGFKVRNFTSKNMKLLEQGWGGVAAALRLTVRLAADFGFSGQTLRAASALLPIAYYLHQRAPGDRYVTSDSFKEDREAIRGWLVRSVLKRGVWGSGLDTMLTEVRRVIREHASPDFPLTQIQAVMAARGKGLTFQAEELDALLQIKIGDHRCFALLALLYHVDLRHNFHIDHFFPKARFSRTRLLKAGVAEEDLDAIRDLRDRLANLQLLEGAYNSSKRDALPHKWMKKHFVSEEARSAYVLRADLGEVPEDMAGFRVFYDARLVRIRNRLKTLLDAEDRDA